jgi:hypothetical protein
VRPRLLIATAAVAGLAALGACGTALAARTSPAATNACGASCTDVGFVNPGFGRAVLASKSGADTSGNLVRLLSGGNGLPKEDFSVTTDGTIVPLYCTPGGQAQAGSLFTANQCHLLVALHYGHDQTYQLAFNPDNGGPEDECVGVVGPKSGDKMRLEPCGVNADTVLIVAPTLPGGSAGAGFWLVNGASDNFSNPNVATSNGTYPSDPTWTKVDYNGSAGIDTQEACAKDGPYAGPVC